MRRAEFDQLMRSLDPALVVLTTMDGRERAGCLVGFHSQCSIDPPRYAVWVSKANHTYRVGSRASHFGLHLLSRSAGHHALAELFGAVTGDDLDKFARCRWTPGPQGVPLLDDVDHRLVLHRVDWQEGSGDHACLIAEPSVAQSPGPTEVLRLTDAEDVHPGHDTRPGGAESAEDR